MIQTNTHGATLRSGGDLLFGARRDTFREGSGGEKGSASLDVSQPLRIQGRNDRESQSFTVSSCSSECVANAGLDSLPNSCPDTSRQMARRHPPFSTPPEGIPRVRRTINTPVDVRVARSVSLVSAQCNQSCCHQASSDCSCSFNKASHRVFVKEHTLNQGCNHLSVSFVIIG